MSNPADPWSFNYFEPQTPKLPPAVKKEPRLLPDVDRLFALQRNMLKVLNNLDALESTVDKKYALEVHRVRRDAENAYKNIRGYLATYANPEGA